ncbi:hypothetical protein [Streptomyces pseudovenezuelae]|uniref:hypothetical protein n=1 Tax=Streptomyces pseudovenezuelae TaxID=67350 RepID=UPI002474D25F|nr:hypothetical protein [Streptomyces pseudovenezuelae]
MLIRGAPLAAAPDGFPPLLTPATLTPTTPAVSSAATAMTTRFRAFPGAALPGGSSA